MSLSKNFFFSDWIDDEKEDLPNKFFFTGI